MLRADEVIQAIERVAPLRLQAPWDNSGWQIGSSELAIQGVLVALDVNQAVVEEAASLQADLIVSHHPLFFRPLNRIDLAAPRGHLIAGIVRNHLQVYSAHTNLDLAPGGVTTALAERLGLRLVGPLEPVEVEGAEAYRAIAPGQRLGWGGIGEPADSLLTDELVELVRRQLGAPTVRVVRGRAVRHALIAICGGSGADFIGRAASLVSAYVTSDVRYHRAQEAQELGLTLIDIDHYYTERPVLQRVANLLRREVAVPVHVSSVVSSPYADHLAV